MYFYFEILDVKKITRGNKIISNRNKVNNFKPYHKTLNLGFKNMNLC